jgi:hypothetical protein
MNVTYWMPAESQEGATRLAHAIHAKRLPMRSYFATEEAANAWAAECNKFLRHPVRVYAVIIETRTTHDGRIPVARIIDGAGSVAAALMIVIGGAYAVGLGSVLS